MSSTSIPNRLPDRKDIDYYIDYLQENYNGTRVTIPEGKDVYFFFGKKEDCMHLICGKGKPNINYSRARTLSWMKYILETSSERIIKQEIKTKNIIFIAEKYNYIIVCKEQKRGFLFIITQYKIKQKKDILEKFLDISKYKNYDFS